MKCSARVHRRATSCSVCIEERQAVARAQFQLPRTSAVVFRVRVSSSRNRKRCGPSASDCKQVHLGCKSRELNRSRELSFRPPASRPHSRVRREHEQLVFAVGCEGGHVAASASGVRRRGVRACREITLEGGWRGGATSTRNSSRKAVLTEAVGFVFKDHSRGVHVVLAATETAGNGGSKNKKQKTKGKWGGQKTCVCRARCALAHCNSHLQLSSNLSAIPSMSSSSSSCSAGLGAASASTALAGLLCVPTLILNVLREKVI